MPAAAATVLAYLFPNEATTFRAMAEEASKSQLYAGSRFRPTTSQEWILDKKRPRVSSRLRKPMAPTPSGRHSADGQMYTGGSQPRQA